MPDKAPLPIYPTPYRQPPLYREPPLVKAYLGHAIGTALLGALLPSGEHLGAVHRLVLPIVELIPNALKITNRAPMRLSLSGMN